MIVGTAGHIDHGKTALVRALTGVDTDRLPEEKRRGISIELGYAFLPDPLGESIGLVDVPGHERLVHTMLAGATGLDGVLLLVAADDGVMPQTREHLAIVTLLGVREGAVVITKCDRVPPARIEEVRHEARELVSGTPLQTAPVFETAAIRGEGVGAVRDWLTGLARRCCAAHDEAAGFRLALDRVFTLSGIGTVVTGTVFAGAVQVEDVVQIVPGDQTARVRSIHAQNCAARRARAGQRCALNLASVHPEQVRRGQWICDPRLALATDRLDARVDVWRAQPQPLRNGQTVHVHIGVEDVAGRLALLQSGSIEPGGRGFVQITLRHAIGAWHSDRIVLRDASASQTLAGGVLLDPCAPARYRKTPERLAQLSALAQGDARQRLDALLEAAPSGVALTPLRRAWGLTSLQGILPPQAVTLGADGSDDLALIASSHFESLCGRLLDAVLRQHQVDPESSGVEVGRLRRIALPRTAPAIVKHVIDALVARGQLIRCAGFLQSREHAAHLSDMEQRLAQRILPLLQAGGIDPPWVRDLARDLKQPDAAVRAALAHQAQRGAVFQVVKDLYVHRQAVERLAATARTIARGEGAVRAAAFRDATGLGRKRAIQILEFFDRVGMLRRVRDDHLLRPGTQLFSQISAAR